MKQLDLFEEIIVDNFAGGGGASTGIELATGRPVTIAINHDPDAILMHQTNHPYTTHYQESVWDIDPEKVCMGRPVGLAWFSPDCKHFSKAKGSKPVDRHIRGLAWIVLRWAGTVRPRVIMLENVEEFQTWGPVRKGKPVKAKAGQTFRKFIRQLKELGYDVQFRELVAADFGAPTTRKRFFMVARCDGKPIVWPEATHAPAESIEVKAGKKLPWRSAAEIIDWNLPCPSVFDTKEKILERYGLRAVRPLRPNTMRRIIRGVDKFTIKSGKPFIVQCNHSGSGHIKDQEKPLGTVLGHHTEGVVMPVIKSANLIQYHNEQTEGVRASGLDAPINTIDGSNRYGLTAACLVEYYSTGKPLDVATPMHTVTATDREALALAHICKFKGQDIGQAPNTPLHTITASPGGFAAVETKVVQYEPGADLRHWPKIRDLLNQYCGYNLEENQAVLLRIGGTWYYIADIGLRMLTPGELYKAMGFPADYIIDRDYTGHEYPRAKQVARCGNAVPPPFATALVRANLPEWCGMSFKTMAEFADVAEG